MSRRRLRRNRPCDRRRGCRGTQPTGSARSSTRSSSTHAKPTGCWREP
jgi:hypothetical protein